MIDARRLIIGAAVVAALLLPLYFLLLRETSSPDGAVSARLLQTPPSGAVTRAGLSAGELAPDFEAPGPDGRPVRLSELRGRAVLINFWATWCGSCLSEMPEIKALQQQRGVDAFSVVAVNAGETPAAAARFIDFLGAPFFYALDADLVISDAYRVHGLPLSVFVDAGGVVRHVFRGHADRSRLETFVQAAIDAREPGPVPPAITFISNIPRERVLLVSAQDGSTLRFDSKSLRCDPAYCAEEAVRSLRSVAGVLRVEHLATGAAPHMAVSFDPRATSEATVVETVTNVLAALPDPVYDRPLEVRYR